MRTPIGSHFTFMSAEMASGGELWPTVTPVRHPEEALALARQEVAAGSDPMDCCFGSLTVFGDGGVTHADFSLDDLQADPATESWLSDELARPRP